MVAAGSMLTGKKQGKKKKTEDPTGTRVGQENLQNPDAPVAMATG